MYPLKFAPVYQSRIWGGRGLQARYGRVLPPGAIGESWEIAAHPNGMGHVAEGLLAGKSIPELIREFGVTFLGNQTSVTALNRFPLLLKLLDVKDHLSVQVHPGDAYALKNEGESCKYEVWYILDAQPEATLIYGLKPGTTRNQFEKALTVGGLAEYLNEIPVKAGEVYLIPPGLVHALKAGLLVFEIQQNSDIVYRIYDYNRKDFTGEKRKLQIKEALDVIDFDDFPPVYPIIPKPNSRLVDSSYFKIDFGIQQNSQRYYNGENRFYILTNLKGTADLIYDQGAIRWLEGESVLIPASLENLTLTGEVTYLKTYLP